MNNTHRLVQGHSTLKTQKQLANSVQKITSVDSKMCISEFLKKH